MSKIPDIRALYQQKYLHHNIFLQSQTHRQCKCSKTHRFRIIQSKYCNEDSSTLIKGVKIIKNIPQSETSQLVEPPETFRRTILSNRTKQHRISQSMHLPQKSTELIRQLMKVTHQEMGELSTSLGGEKRLLNMFQNFFERRSKTNQMRRQQGKKSTFTPIHPQRQHINKRFTRYTQQNRRDIDPKLKGSIVEKDLAPWNFQDAEFS